jgi:hypothetical protein
MVLGKNMVLWGQRKTTVTTVTTVAAAAARDDLRSVQPNGGRSMRNKIFGEVQGKMMEDVLTTAALAEVEHLTEGVIYSFCRVMRPSDNDPEWRTPAGREEMVAFAPIIAAMITAAVDRYTELERRRLGDEKSPWQVPRAV